MKIILAGSEFDRYATHRCEWIYSICYKISFIHSYFNAFLDCLLVGGRVKIRFLEIILILGDHAFITPTWRRGPKICLVFTDCNVFKQQIYC